MKSPTGADAEKTEEDKRNEISTSETEIPEEGWGSIKDYLIMHCKIWGQNFC